MEFSKEAIEARIAELRVQLDEANRLERILSVWDGPAKVKATARATSSTATRTNGNGDSSRAGRGRRPQQFLAAVTDSPGITANDLATEMECNINYVYRLAKDLSDRNDADGAFIEGVVEKRGKGFFPKGYVEGEAAPEVETPDADTDTAPEPEVAVAA